MRVCDPPFHPEAVGMRGCAGHFTRFVPVALGKGAQFNELLEIDLDHMDPVNLNLDLCVKIRVSKDPNPPRGRSSGRMNVTSGC